MKILLVHNDYGKYSGEEAVVDKMAKIFSDLGHEVAQLRMSTADSRDSLKGKISVFTSGLHSYEGIKAMREALEREKPDVVNVHNVFPFISPAALRECKRAGVPVVMTVHNYRLICPTGLFMRNGRPCEICLQNGNEWSCVRYNCENSTLKSVAYAARNAIARRKRHFMDCVDCFACITDFQRQKLIDAGFPANKITVIPNAIELTSSPESLPSAASSPYVAFCGRLSAEKGIDLILQAARNLPHIQFKLAGATGDPALVENLPENVTLLGYVKGKDLEEFYRNSQFVIMASRCYEGFPMAILEAAKYGKPAIVPDHGGFTEIIKSLTNDPDKETTNHSPLLFTPGDADSLTYRIDSLMQHPDQAERLGNLAFENLKKLYTTEVTARKWEALITSLCNRQ